jgi:hypothetical protein
MISNRSHHRRRSDPTATDDDAGGRFSRRSPATFPARPDQSSPVDGWRGLLPAGSSGFLPPKVPELSAGSFVPIINARPLAILLLAVALLGVAAIGTGWL